MNDQYPDNTVQSELDELKQQQQLERILSQNADVINARDVAALIKPDVRFTPNGIDEQSVTAAISKLRRTSPYAFRSQRADSGAPPATASGFAATTRDFEMCTLLFGRKPNSALAQKLFREDPVEYRRLRSVALTYDLLGK